MNFLALYADDEIEEIHEKEEKNPDYEVMLRLQMKRNRIEKPRSSLDELRVVEADTNHAQKLMKKYLHKMLQ